MENTTVIKKDWQIEVKELVRIWNACQKQKAKASICKADRKKTTLSQKEIYNKLAQLGRVLRYKEVTFTFDSGSGLLRKANGSKIWGATYSDFINEINKAYPHDFN